MFLSLSLCLSIYPFYPFVHSHHLIVCLSFPLFHSLFVRLSIALTISSIDLYVWRPIYQLPISLTSPCDMGGTHQRQTNHSEIWHRKYLFYADDVTASLGPGILSTCLMTGSQRDNSEEPITVKRSVGCQKKRFKDSLRVSFNRCGINPEHLGKLNLVLTRSV